jgi:hypothetical protein
LKKSSREDGPKSLIEKEFITQVSRRNDSLQPEDFRSGAHKARSQRKSAIMRQSNEHMVFMTYNRTYCSRPAVEAVRDTSPVLVDKMAVASPSQSLCIWRNCRHNQDLRPLPSASERRQSKLC